MDKLQVSCITTDPSTVHWAWMADWWERRGHPVADPSLFPPTGRMVFYDSIPVCAGFLYKTDGKLAVISHVVSSPDKMNAEARDQCLDLLISTLVHEAHLAGMKAVSASSNVAKLNKRYEKLGFTKTDSDETHYGRVL